MSFQSLIAHNGISHQKSSATDRPTLAPTETKTDRRPHSNSPAMMPEANSTSQQPGETSEIMTDRATEALTIIETPLSDPTEAILFPGLGESIFALLITSPVLLLGFKKWLHR